MKSLGKVALPVLSVAIVIAAVFALRRPEVKEAPAPAAAKDTGGKVQFLMEQQWRIHMKLARAEAREVAPQIVSTGRIVAAPRNQAVVSSAVAGIVSSDSLPIVGQKVSRGQTLAVLNETLSASTLAQLEADTAQFKLGAAQHDLNAAQFELDSARFELDSAQLQVSSAQTQQSAAQLRMENVRIEAERRRLAEAIQEAKARRDLAKTELDRSARLFERKAYSQKQVQEAEAAYKAAEAGVAALTVQLETLAPVAAPQPPAARAAVAAPPVRASAARPNAPAAPVTSHAIRSPIAGTIVKVYKANGEHAQPGEPLFEIVNLETVWVEAPVFEKDLARLKTGVRAIFSTASNPHAEFVGKLINVGSVLDEHTRAATVLFEAPNPAAVLRIGMQANIRLDAEESVKAVMIPKEAVLDNEGKKIVYRLVSGEEFERVEVQTGDEYGDMVSVLSGLEAGQRVVTQGAYQLKLQELSPAGATEHTHEV